jgi:hypothetical protein
MAAFGTATSQYFSSIGGLHAFAKTMNGFAATAMRLKCTFHFKSVFSRLPNNPWRTGLVSVYYLQVTIPVGFVKGRQR